MQYFDRVREIVHDVTGIPMDRILPDSTAAQLGVDSLDLTEIILTVEEEFDVLIEDDKSILGMNDLIHCLELSA